MRRVLLYILYVVVVVGLIISIVAAFHHKKVADKKQKATETSKQTGKPAKPSAGSATQLARPDYTPPASNQTKPSPTPSTSQSTPATSAQLSNSGPGEVVALFIGTTILGAAAFSAYQRRLAASL